jgi:cytochrome b involved in lipid metabolism
MAVKRLIYSLFIAFWASAATIVTLAALAPEIPPGKTGRVVSRAELAKHNTVQDCWMAIEGKVYDFTAYIPQHPTSPKVMLRWCGREATEAYRTKGYGKPHSPAADARLPEYLVGELENK